MKGKTLRTVQVLPTEYRGVQFRSRTEARWAVFFDALLLPWEYEKEGYALPSGNYLPDFWLEGIGWFEVKGEAPNEREEAVAFDLAKATGHHVFIAHHNHSAPLDIDGVPAGWSDSIRACFSDGGGDYRYAFCLCEGCLADKVLNVGLQFEARSERQCSGRGHGHGGKCYTGNHRLIRNAYEKARTYRFWNPQ